MKGLEEKDSNKKSNRGNNKPHINMLRIGLIYCHTCWLKIHAPSDDDAPVIREFCMKVEGCKAGEINWVISLSNWNSVDKYTVAVEMIHPFPKVESFTRISLELNGIWKI